MTVHVLLVENEAPVRVFSWMKFKKWTEPYRDVGRSHYAYSASKLYRLRKIRLIDISTINAQQSQRIATTKIDDRIVAMGFDGDLIVVDPNKVLMINASNGVKVLRDVVARAISK